MAEKRTVQAVARRIGAFFRENRRMPTYSEMIGLLGVRSKSVVHFWVKKLLAEGLLERRCGTGRVWHGSNHITGPLGNGWALGAAVLSSHNVFVANKVRAKQGAV